MSEFKFSGTGEEIRQAQADLKARYKYLFVNPIGFLLLNDFHKLQERESWPEAPGEILYQPELALSLLLSTGEVIVDPQKKDYLRLVLIITDVFPLKHNLELIRIPHVSEGDDITPDTVDFWALYESMRKNPTWGSIQWAARYCNVRPREEIVSRMKKDEVWTDDLEELPQN